MYRALTTYSYTHKYAVRRLVQRLSWSHVDLPSTYRSFNRVATVPGTRLRRNLPSILPVLLTACSTFYLYLDRSLLYDHFLLSLTPSSTSLANAALDVVAHQKINVTDIYNPYAHFSLEVAQDINSLETITEIDPLEIAEIFGEVGGAWGKKNRI